MPELKITIKNLDEFEKAMANSPKIVGKHLSRAVQIAGNEFLAGTIQNIKSSRNMWKSPIDTGFMWNTIFIRTTALEAVIYPVADYAIFVHEGTNRMRARPFFEITKDTESGNIERIFENELEKAMREVENNV